MRAPFISIELLNFRNVHLELFTNYHLDQVLAKLWNKNFFSVLCRFITTNCYYLFSNVSRVLCHRYFLHTIIEEILFISIPLAMFAIFSGSLHFNIFLRKVDIKFNEACELSLFSYKRKNQILCIAKFVFLTIHL